MAKSLQTLVTDCCQMLEQDFVDLFARTARKSGYTSPLEPIARDAALDSFLEIAAICSIEGQPWFCGKKALSEVSDGEHIKQHIIERRQFLQTECPLLSPFFLFQHGFPSKVTFRKVYAFLRETVTLEEWRTEQILGWMYQYALQGRPDEQKQHGQFYTSESVVEYIVAQTFRLALAERKLSPAFSVLDLACGAGGFALKAFEELYQWHTRTQPEGLPDPVSHILEHQLFLVDNDPRACQIAAFNLYVKARRLSPECQIRRLNIICADALRKWEHETSNVIQDSPRSLSAFLKNIFSQKYHLIVGNPPYIVINRLQTPKELLELYKSYQSAAFKINTFALFVERGIELLKPNGILGMIVPNTLLTQIYFEPLRQYILSTSRIRSLLDTKRLFERAFVENCIILLQRELEQQRRSQNPILCQATIASDLKRCSSPAFENCEPGNTPAVIPQHHFEYAPFKMFNISIDAPTYALMQKIARNKPKLGELCESHDGFNPGNAKGKFIVHEAVDATCKKVLNGKDIGRYHLQWGGLYVRYDRGLLVKDDIVRWGHSAALESAKILTRQTADRVIGTFEPGMYYTTNSIHTTILHNDVQHVHLKYVLGVLNSTLMTWYYRKLISEVGQVFSQVKLINLRQLPILPATEKHQQEIVALVETLLQLNPQSSSFADADTRLDQEIYRLYQLTPAEIERVERL